MLDIKIYNRLTIENSVTDENKSVCLYGNERREMSKYAIVIPTYKRGEGLKKAIDSAIKQDVNDSFEIIIVDNNHDFDCKEVLDIVKEYDNDKIIYYKNKTNIGAENNFNRGILLAKSKYFVMLHDDDQLLPNCISECAKNINGSRAIFNQYNIVENGVVTNTSAGRSLIGRLYDIPFKIAYALNPNKGNVTSLDLFNGLCPVGVIGVMYHRDAFLDVGGFNKGFYPGSDLAVNTLYIAKNGAYLLNIPLANYNVGQNDSMTISTTFPTFNFEIRKQVLGFIVDDNKKNRNTCTALYFFEKADCERLWGVKCDSVSNEELGLWNDEKQKKFMRKRAVRSKVRFGK